jgi:hypothetical protein
VVVAAVVVAGEEERHVGDAAVDRREELAR